MTIKYYDKGIDYAHGMANVHPETGIRYGVISQNLVLQAWADDSEPEYPCGECDAWDSNNDCCNDDGFDCEPIAWNYQADGYKATCGSDGDIFVMQSPFYTFAQFCSPCAPGACYLANPVSPSNDGNKCYCFGEDWFDSDYEPCPYPIWRVKDNVLVYEPK